jgi:hypothetical protein
MTKTTSARRWGLCAAAAVGLSALAPMSPAAAATQTSFLDVSSGQSAPSGGATSLATVSTDGGATFQPATVVTPLPDWAVPTPGAWISSDAERGVSTAGTTTFFRQEFRVGPAPVSSGLEVCVHAADAAVVRLNGTQIGAQPASPVEANAQAPADCFALPVENLVGGGNVLEFAVDNASGELGLWFRLSGLVTTDTDAAPVLELPDDIVVDATGPDGAVVTYAAGAVYPGPGPWPGTPCTPPSGSTFPVGTTTVSCTATNPASGASDTGTFTVTVTAPNQPPELQLPADVTVAATSSAGAAVPYTVTASDDGAVEPVVSCTPASGAVFAVGTTTVECTASDAEGLTDTGSFTVTVTPAAPKPTYLARLGAAIDDAHAIRHSVRALLARKHDTATEYFADRRKAAGCRVLKEMDGVVLRYRGAGIPVATANSLRKLIKAARAEARC